MSVHTEQSVAFIMGAGSAMGQFLHPTTWDIAACEIQRLSCRLARFRRLIDGFRFRPGLTFRAIPATAKQFASTADLIEKVAMEEISDDDLDTLLLAQASIRWQKLSMVVAKTMRPLLEWH